MFNLFRKKHLTRDAFIAKLLDLQQEMVSVLLRLSEKQLAPTIKEGAVKLECEVLSLWILSLAISLATSDDADALKDEIHNQYCAELVQRGIVDKYKDHRKKPLLEHNARDFDSEFKNHFLTFADKRYQRYFEGYNIWVKDHQAGAMLGSAILRVFKGEADSGKLQLDAFATLNAFSLFMEVFKAALQSIGDIKKRYDLSDIEGAV